jgi:hypothetical protein
MTIRQGVKAPDNTVPTQIRIDKSQLRVLKILAALHNTTISGIVRECLGRYIDEHGQSDATKDALSNLAGRPEK